MATASQVSDLMSSAASSVAAGDYATAHSKALQALALRATIPDGAFDGLETTWRVAEIQAFLTSVQRQRGAEAGIQTTKITRHRPSF